MRQVVATVFVAVALLTPGAAGAGERVTDGALGAASGALVAGPIGFVAGGVIGYVAGPNISRGLGLHHHHHHYYGRHASAPRNEREARSDNR